MRGAMAAINEWATVRVVQAAHKTAEDLSAHYLAPGSTGASLDLAICCFDGFKLAASATRIRAHIAGGEWCPPGAGTTACKGVSR